MSEKIDQKNRQTDKKAADTKPKKKSNKKLKIIIGIILIVTALIGFNVIKDSKLRQERFAAVKQQRQVMIDYWVEQGLSQEEINQKLKEQKPSEFGNYQPSIFRSVMRTVRHSTGTGPGTRSK